MIGDVVIGRGWVDNYLMSLAHSAKRSLVDVTFAGMLCLCLYDE